MSQAKQKLVFKTAKDSSISDFRLVKAVNTLKFGSPGETFTKAEVEKILRDNTVQMKHNDLTVEFING